MNAFNNVICEKKKFRKNNRVYIIKQEFGSAKTLDEHNLTDDLSLIDIGVRKDETTEWHKPATIYMAANICVRCVDEDHARIQ